MTHGVPRDSEAVDWVVRLRDPAFADWEGFIAWLQGRPQRNALYDQAALVDRELDAILPSVALPAVRRMVAG